MIPKLRSAWTGLQFRPWTVPLALLFLVLCSYGLRAVSLGFYWDDFPYLWIDHAFGAKGIYAALGPDRPLLAVLYSACLSLLGASPLAWQVFAMLMRWLCCLGLWLGLIQAWPAQREKAAWAAALFAVYPGFTQQSISLIYGQAFLLYALLFFSIALTAWAAACRKNLALYTLPALLLSTFTMFSTEYFFGLELLRPALLWLVFRNQGLPPRRRLGKTLLAWLPFLALMLVFVYYRAVSNPYGGASLSLLSNLQKSPLQTLGELAGRVAGDLVESTVAAWGQTLQLGGIFDANPAQGFQLLAVILLVGAAAWGYFARLGDMKPADGPQRAWPAQAVVVGGLAMLAAGWPIWVTGLPLKMGWPLDRYTLMLAPGACLLLAGLVDWLFAGAGRGRGVLVLALALGLAAGFQFTVSGLYRDQWIQARSLIWQLAWRAPGIQPGTALLEDNLGLTFYEDDSLSGALNWLYTPSPGEAPGRMDVVMLHIPERSIQLGNLTPGKAFVKDLRAASFTGSTSQVVVFIYNPPGCLQVLDPRYDLQRSDLPEFVQRALPLSRPELLLANPAQPVNPPEILFGSEPKRKWCYYFEKAGLARQAGDWQQIIDLARQSINAGYRPDDPLEYLPFVEGYLRDGRWPDAYQLSIQTFNTDGGARVRPALCALWAKDATLMAPLNEVQQVAWKRLKEGVKCGDE